MTDGMDAYLRAMWEAAEAGEPVDWNGVDAVISDTLEREREQSVSAEEVSDGYYADSFYAEYAV